MKRYAVPEISEGVYWVGKKTGIAESSMLLFPFLKGQHTTPIW